MKLSQPFHLKINHKRLQRSVPQEAVKIKTTEMEKTKIKRVKAKARAIKAGGLGTVQTHQIAVVTATTVMVTLLGTVWRQRHVRGSTR